MIILYNTACEDGDRPQPKSVVSHSVSTDAAAAPGVQVRCVKQAKGVNNMPILLQHM